MRGLYSNRIATTRLASNLESPPSSADYCTVLPISAYFLPHKSISITKDIVIAIDKVLRRLTTELIYNANSLAAFGFLYHPVTHTRSLTIL
jgi:hypothetical protein